MLVEQVLAMKTDFEPVVLRAPDEVRIEQGEALLIEPRYMQFELLALAAVRKGRVRIQPSVEQRGVVGCGILVTQASRRRCIASREDDCSVASTLPRSGGILAA